MSRFALQHIVHEPRIVSSGGAPLLILLHGVGSNEEDLMGLAPMLDPRFFVVSARAPIALGPLAFGWFRIDFTPSGLLMDPVEAEASRKLLLEFVDQVVAAYPVDPKRVYLMGFSQGCVLSLSAALTEPRKFAGVVGMSGRMLPATEAMLAERDALAGLPILLVHGTLDDVLPIEQGRAARAFLEQLPVLLEYREYPMAHQVSEASMRDIRRWLGERLNSSEDWRVGVL